MNRLVDVIDRGIGILTAIILAVALILLAVSVFARYVAVGWHVDWVQEVVVFLIVWAILLSVARIDKRGGHIRLDFFVDRLRPRFRTPILVFGMVFGLAVAAFFIYAGYLVVEQSIAWDERTDSSLLLPFWLYYASLPVSFVIQGLFIVNRLINVLSGHDTGDVANLSD